MPRVSEETIEKLRDFLDSLPEYARNKCALCNETLTHLVKSAEAETGAGTATVTRELAKRIDNDAAPGSKPDGERLRKRVGYQEEDIRRKSPNNTLEPEAPTITLEENPQPPEKPVSLPLHNHRAQGTGENEWYTPQEYIKKAREVLGDIDLDPATSEMANQEIQALSIYTVEEDGLSREWQGRVWLNPPYSQPAISDFSNKMANEWRSGRLQSAIVLTHNYTDTRWFQLLASECTAICFTRGRIAFINQYGEKAAPTQGQAFFYFGKDLAIFIDAFKDIGFVVEVK